MNLLIFGYGMIAQRQYLPNMRKLARKAEPPIDLQVQCVDKGKPGCFEVESWEHEPAIRPEEIDKILILSPPNEHYANLAAIANRCASLGCAFPKIYIEKPIYLESERERWTELLAKHAGLEDRAFYIDHYRFKDALVWFQAHKAGTLGSIGKIHEIGLVSLEKQKFWNSAAFEQGYFLEHGCHLVSMMDRVFPGIAARQWTPQRTGDWRVWEQAGRPPLCKRDSACLSHLRMVGGDYPEFAAEVALTAVVGKGMLDAKVLHLGGENGSAQVWFNKGQLVVAATGQRPARMEIPTGNPYRAVAESIISVSTKPELLSPLTQGLAEQEKVIQIRRHLPAHAETYAVGETPREIARELARMGLQDIRIDLP